MDRSFSILFFFINLKRVEKLPMTDLHTLFSDEITKRRWVRAKDYAELVDAHGSSEKLVDRFVSDFMDDMCDASKTDPFTEACRATVYVLCARCRRQRLVSEMIRCARCPGSFFCCGGCSINHRLECGE